MALTLFSGKDSRKSATILRAVPKPPADETSLRPNKRETTIHAYQDSKDSVKSSAEDQQRPLHPHVQNDTSSSISRLNSIFSNTSLKGAIGTYNHGRIHWRHKDHSPTEHKTRVTDRALRPRIRVVIPDGRRNQPLPALPFFANTKHETHATSQNHTPDISPPSGNHKALRDSVVSPLGQLQSQSVHFGNIQRPMSHNSLDLTIHPKLQHNEVYGSSGASSDSQESDASPVGSANSSRTSVDADQALVLLKETVLQSHTSQERSGTIEACVEGRSSLPGMLPPRRYAHHVPIEEDDFFHRTCTLLPAGRMANNIARAPMLTRKSSRRVRSRRSTPIKSSASVIDKTIRDTSSAQIPCTKRVASPTLSEAEDDLNIELSLFIKSNAVDRKEVENKENIVNLSGQAQKDLEILYPATAPPAVPRKSSKRKRTASGACSRLSQNTSVIAESNNLCAHQRPQRLTLAIPEYGKIREQVKPLSTEIQPSASPCLISPGDAEAVIFGILDNIDHLEDLFAAAILNHGFYCVFKRHELSLIKSTLRKMSPPAWEFREIAYPGHELLRAEELEVTRPDEEYVPTTYLQLQKRDVQVIRAIKKQIINKCQSFLRPEMSYALIQERPAQSARVDNALWRIWSFCKIFGSGKGREEDIVAQMDWLRGGVMAHQDACTSSFMNTDFMNDTLIGAPDSFGLGNQDGLSAEELFDIMELWTCMGVLLQGFEGRTVAARTAGIYDCTDVRGGDIDGEEAMLGMYWIGVLRAYQLTTFR